MSITNYFGKPRAKYVPYKSPYTFDHLPNSNIAGCAIRPIVQHGPKVKMYFITSKIMNTNGSYGSTDVNDITAEELKLLEVEAKKLDSRAKYLPSAGDFNPFELCYSNTHTEDPARQVYKLSDIGAMFNEVIEECLKWIEYPIWKLLNIPPPISIYQIILLKLSDVSKQVDHHEETIAFLVNDNTLLNNRIKSLENSLALLIKKSHIPIAEPIAEHITVAEAVLKC